MNMKDLKVGMRVYLRDDLQVDYYGNFLWSEQAGMLKGQWVTISSIHPRYNYFTIDGCHNELPYDVEMIDWVKTKE